MCIPTCTSIHRRLGVRAQFYTSIHMGSHADVQVRKQMAKPDADPAAAEKPATIEESPYAEKQTLKEPPQVEAKPQGPKQLTARF